MPVTEYTWDPVSDSILEETDGAGIVTASYTNEPSAYGPLISQHRDGQSRFFHFDALGSTRELTDEDENVTDTFAYDAWGNRLELITSSPSPFQFLAALGYHSKTAVAQISVRARTYASRLARWTVVDPLWPTDSYDGYIYGRNSPQLQMDPSGLKCYVCSGARTILRVGIARLDADYVGTPFRALADAVTGAFNSNFNPPLQFPIPLPRAGLYFARVSGQNHGLLAFLMFVAFDICETQIPPGECRLFLDERGTRHINTDGQGNISIRVGGNEGDITDGHDVLKADLITSLSNCDKSLIFGDFPGGDFILGRTGFTKRLRQVIEVRDSATGEVVASTTNYLDFSVSVVPTFNPSPDTVYTINR